MNCGLFVSPYGDLFSSLDNQQSEASFTTVSCLSLTARRSAADGLPPKRPSLPNRPGMTSSLRAIAPNLPRQRRSATHRGLGSAPGYVQRSASFPDHRSLGSESARRRKPTGRRRQAAATCLSRPPTVTAEHNAQRNRAAPAPAVQSQHACAMRG